ncbi:MAG: lipoate protein ligase C-terminal domain-containing protein [Candidatus Nanohalobium sp.]
MTQQEASHKVPEGKMVKIKFRNEDGTVYDVQIRGDFFIEPPEKLQELENRIEGIDVEASRKEITEKLAGIDADLIGFSSEDVAEAFRKAAGDGE